MHYSDASGRAPSARASDVLTRREQPELARGAATKAHPRATIAPSLPLVQRPSCLSVDWSGYRD